MAEINVSSQKNKAGVKRVKKLSTKIDLTPMVDLGFLLITFFIFTTTMNEATAMKFFLPEDTDNRQQAPESGALTLLLSNDDIVYYYEGLLEEDGANLKSTPFRGLRDVIINKKKITKPADLVIIIKPDSKSRYKNTVDAFDEMNINDVKRYALVDISTVEDGLIAKAATAAIR